MPRVEGCPDTSGAEAKFRDSEVRVVSEKTLGHGACEFDAAELKNVLGCWPLILLNRPVEPDPVPTPN